MEIGQYTAVAVSERHFIRCQNGVSVAHVIQGFSSMETVYGNFWHLSQLEIWEKVLADFLKIKHLTHDQVNIRVADHRCTTCQNGWKR